MNPALHEPVGSCVDVLKLVGSDVLALGKFEDVFGPVNDLKRSVWVDGGNVSRTEPSIMEGLFCLFSVFIVPFCNLMTFQTYLTLRWVVGVQISHFWDISQLDFDTSV